MPTAKPDHLPASATDMQEAHLLLRDTFTDDELKQLPLLPEGTQLDDGAVYVDLLDPGREPIRATGGMTAGEAQLLVPQAGVSDRTWHRLLEQVPAGQTGG